MLQGHQRRMRWKTKMDAVCDERLCEEVRRHPHLYDFKQYKNIDARDNSWREIAQTLGIEESVCRQKWKCLKDRFLKARKKLRGRSGRNANVPPIISLLGWLSDFVNHRSTDCNLPVEAEEGSGTVTETIGNGDAHDSSTSPRSFTPFPPPTPSPTAAPQSPLSTSSSASTSDRFSPTTSRKRKYRLTPVEDAILQRLQQIDQARDDHRQGHHFGIMVADMLAKLPARERMEAQFEIYQLLYRKQKKIFDEDLSQ